MLNPSPTINPDNTSGSTRSWGQQSQQNVSRQAQSQPQPQPQPQQTHSRQVQVPYIQQPPHQSQERQLSSRLSQDISADWTITGLPRERPSHPNPYNQQVLSTSFLPPVNINNSHTTNLTNEASFDNDESGHLSLEHPYPAYAQSTQNHQVGSVGSNTTSGVVWGNDSLSPAFSASPYNQEYNIPWNFDIS